MHKYRARGRDLGVIVNQEGKVGHGLVAAVRGDLEIFRGFVGRSIDIVDANVVAICEGCYPGWITVCVHVETIRAGFFVVERSGHLPRTLGRVGAVVW
jgi:hypothetical protein